jgi:hypothetical protein
MSLQIPMNIPGEKAPSAKFSQLAVDPAAQLRHIGEMARV